MAMFLFGNIYPLTLLTFNVFWGMKLSRSFLSLFTSEIMEVIQTACELFRLFLIAPVTDNHDNWASDHSFLICLTRLGRNSCMLDHNVIEVESGLFGSDSLMARLFHPISGMGHFSPLGAGHYGTTNHPMELKYMYIYHEICVLDGQ